MGGVISPALSPGQTSRHPLQDEPQRNPSDGAGSPAPSSLQTAGSRDLTPTSSAACPHSAPSPSASRPHTPET